MKKSPISCFRAATLAVFILTACSKETLHKYSPIQSTSQLYLKSGATGVTLEQAKILGKQFLQSRSGKPIDIVNAQTILHNGVPYFHVINTNAGFIILSPDSTYPPLLAYDTIGNFSFEASLINPGLGRWLNKHAHEMDFIRASRGLGLDSIRNSNKLLWQGMAIAVPSGNAQLAISPKQDTKPIVQPAVPPPTVVSVVPATVTTNSTVGPLCPTIWGQDFPFNANCPAGTYSFGHVPTGCVETAMGQIMYFWKHPITYNWANMPLTSNQYWNDYYTGVNYPNDCSRLLSDIGKTEVTNLVGSTSQFASYSDSNTGSDDTYCPPVFYAFGYSSATRTETISDQVLSGAKSGTAYASLLTNEIQTYERPCMVGGYDAEQDILGVYAPYPNNGHEWVCDGSNVTTYYNETITTYKSYTGVISTQTVVNSITNLSLLHMNWGWEGPTYEVDITGQPLTNNGWYNCNIDYTEANPGTKDFTYFQTIIYLIHP